MADALIVAGLIAIPCLLLPLSGWWLAARLRADSLFRFTAACLIGITTLALAELFAYVLRLPQAAAVAILAITCAASLPPIARAIRARDFAWDALLIWAGSSAILVSASLNFAVHGLPDAVWDWYEHWQRALIFLRQAPETTRIGIYIMPARGPLFNAAAALLLQLSGSAHYWVFQIFATTFNVLVCLAFAMLLTTIAGVSRRNALFIAAGVTVVMPWFFWENTFTWTKDLTAAFVLLGTHEYLLAYRKGDRGRMALSLCWLSPGFLCHYLALLYAATLGVHLLFTAPIRVLPVRALFRTGIVWALLIAPWFGFMMWHFGIKRTLGANTSIGGYYAAEDAQGRRVPLPYVFAANICVDLLPGAFCRPLLPAYNPPGCLAVTADATTITTAPEPCPIESPQSPFLTWNGIYAKLGYSGLLAALAGIIALRGKPSDPDTRFLLWVLSVGLLFNVLPLRWFDFRGTFEENLQAWFLLFAALVVKGLTRLSRADIAVLALAMAVEFGTIDLNLIRLQSVVLPLTNDTIALQGRPPIGPLLPITAPAARFHAPDEYYRNYQFKVRGGAIFFRDLHPDTFLATSWITLAIGVLCVALGSLRREHTSI